MANVTYTVQKGDTLSSIATEYNTTVSSLVALNNITNPNYIVIGQVLIISGTAATPATTTTSRPTIKAFGLQSNTDRTMYATWEWTKSNTDHYEVRWIYSTGDGVAFIGQESTTTSKQSLYNAPSNANKVRFKVRPISKTYTKNGKETSYWTADWSTDVLYAFAAEPPAKPSAPTVTIDNYTLTVKLENLDTDIATVEFDIVKDDKSRYKLAGVAVSKQVATFSYTVTAGSVYKARARVCNKKGLYSEWSDYSSNVGTMPSATGGISTLYALSETSVYLSWSGVSNAESYDIEYTTDRNYFDSSGEVSLTSVKSVVTHAEITGLTAGEEYFFRVRAVNEKGESAWSSIRSIVIGEPPAAPTTWSSTTTAITGEELTVYWVHNSEDGSSQTYAELEMYVNGIRHSTQIQNTTNEDEKDKTSSYAIDTSKYYEGTKILWRIRTAGITGEYGEWSVQRTIDIYSPPTVMLNVTDSLGDWLTSLRSFPFYLSATAYPETQTAIGYHVAVIANERHEAVDNLGNVKLVNKGETVYSKYFDTTSELHVTFSANNINLENNISYTITCSVSMNSGLTAESSSTFTVSWTDELCEPNAEISIDETTYAAYICPYCVDGEENLIQDVLLSVYRREFDGQFTEIIADIENTGTTTITDPHPALDFARYRIVAKYKSTGAISYCDLPGYPVGGKAVVIQWDEEWSTFDTPEATIPEMLDTPSWSGSLLQLPYNVDVSDDSQPDVALIEYIGRSHPVSYYGTQVGATATWNVAVPSDDEETLYALRRLSRYMGDVYVREPSGSGYWANASVSFSQKHKDVTIPVTLKITRVEGGV